MTSKERVFKAIKRQKLPDRAPLQLDLSEALLKKFSEKYEIPLHYGRSYYEDLTYRTAANDLRTTMGSDIVVVGGGFGKGFELNEDENGVIVNEFGMKMCQGPVYMDMIEPPLSNLTTLEQAENYRFPNPHDPERYKQAEEDIAKFKGDYFIIGDVEVTLFAMARQLLGMEKFLLDMMMMEPYIEVLLKKSKEFSLGVAAELVKRGVDAIWFGDDYGTQNSLIMDIQQFRRIFKPLMTNLISDIKKINSDIIIIQHSDGAVAPILYDFIETGVEIFNPVQPGVPGHKPQELKDEFGDRLSFFGAIDQQYLLPNGTPKEIEENVKSKIKILGKGGGYICAPAHIIQADTSMKNVEAFINAVKKHGQY
jgi:uroporphyrinogen decarboxylase